MSILLKKMDRFLLPYLDEDHRYSAIEEFVKLSEEENNIILTKIGQNKCIDPHSYQTEEELHQDLAYLHKCFEEGKIPDEILLQTIQFNDYYFFLLLLFIFDTHPFENEYGLQAGHCIIFIANIHEHIWNEFLEHFYTLQYHHQKLPPGSNTLSTEKNQEEVKVEEEEITNHHLDLLFQIIDRLLQKLQCIQNYEYPKFINLTYAGYDHRDANEYHTEGYEALETEKQQLIELKAKHEHLVETFLMILYQIFYIKNDIIMIQIEENRLDLLSSNEQTLQKPSSSSSSSSPIRIEKIMITKLLFLTEEIAKFSFRHHFQSNENITQLCIKIVIFISSQFPLFNFKTTEIADTIVILDGSNESSGMYAQGILVSLNESGYPNMNMKETFATIRFCINIFYSEANDVIQHLQSSNQGEGGEEDRNEGSSHGNFYVNDLKILLEVCMRELVNIPMEPSYQELRLRYLELIQAIIVKGDWKHSCASYKERELLNLLQEIKTSDYESNQLLADEILNLIET